jgi:hypothetical protein
VIAVSDEVREAQAVVALETTLVAHGFPVGEGVAVGLEAERRVRAAGAVPATIGVLDGTIRVGLEAEELERFDSTARKVGPRDLAVCAVQRAVGATTAGGTLNVCRAVGLRFMGTGGLGGVHRDAAASWDVSADLDVLAAMARSVVPGGRVVVSAFSAYFQVRVLSDTDAFDADLGLNHERTEVRDEQGRPTATELWTSCFTPRELRLLAERAGLEVEHLWSVRPAAYGRRRPDLEHEELLLVARPAQERRW